VGAYAFGLAQLKAGAGLWSALGLAILAAATAGALVAAFISHRRGIYYALLTIAFGQVFWFVAIKWHGVTGGEDGLLNIRRPALVASADALHFFALGALVVVALFLWRLVHSPYGRVLGAVKQNETRAAFAGHNTWLYKWSAFVISCAIAGLAGALFALAQQSAYPNVMSLHNSGFVVMMVLVGGGLVSFWGPVVGAAFFLLARDLLGAYTETWLLWYGLLFMAMVLFRPEGIVGMWRDAVAKWRPTEPVAPKAGAA
jgi:branched-chain amino acid transport system permease protein